MRAGTIVDTGLDAEISARIGRQAIYDRALNSWAYELFYRGSDANVASYSDADAATGSVILSAFAELGLNKVVGDKHAFINTSSSAMTGELPLPVPAGRVTLEIRSYEHSSSTLKEAIKRRRAEGFRVALDDFVFDDASRELLTCVDYVKLDYRRLGPEGIVEHQRLLSGHDVESIGMKLENQTEYDICLDAGLKYFQGHFLFKPQVLRHKRMPPSFGVVSELFAKLQQADVDFSEVEDLVSRDPALSLAVLRFLRSAAYSPRHEVKSIGQAVSLLGLTEFSKWVTLVALAATTRKPSELLLVALIRGKASENLARQTGHAHPGSAFLVGLFSALDALLEQPLEELLAELPLTDDVRVAITRHEGELGRILEAIMARENPHLPASSFDDQAVSEAWLAGVQWAETTRQAMATTPGAP